MSDPQYANGLPVSHHSEESVGTVLLMRKPHRFLVSDWEYYYTSTVGGEHVYR